MRNLKIANTMLLILSTAVLCSCWLFFRNIVPDGLFILESRDGAKFGIIPGRLEKAENLYTEMKFDTSRLEKGVLMITVSPYEMVKSYRRVEEAAKVLHLSEYTLYEAGLMPKSIAEKAILALWCLLTYVLVCAGFLLFGFFRRNRNRECSLLEHMYFGEFLKKRWKQVFSIAVLFLGYIGVVVVFLCIMMTIIPLLPIISENTGIRLWSGLTGMGLLPETSILQDFAVLKKLWTVNSVSNLGLVVFLSALVFMVLITYRPSRFTKGL
ncbi:MAG: hypothetical protein ACOYI1_08015 [Caldicoprobacteraceae bacterium]|jgi:hypothetical protein